MNEEELAELQKEGTWAWDRAEFQAGVAYRGTVLAIRFDRSEMEVIRGRAERLGITAVEYVRRCALKAAAN